MCRPAVQTPAPAQKPSPATPPPPPVDPAITPPASGNPKPVAATNAATDIYMEEIAGLELVRVNGGCYAMGCGPWSPDCDEDERPVHEVCVDDFWISLYEVTNEQYVTFLNDVNTRGPNGERWFQTESENPEEARITGEVGHHRVTSGYEKHPVACVSWYGANAYVRWLSKKTGRSYSLPTEAEWEYAARSGGRSEPYAGGDNVDRFAWYSGNSGDSLTHSVGQLDPNGLGIFDMSGNVWEWVADGYSDTAYLKHTRKNPLVDLLTGTEGPEKGIRGGSWRYAKSRCRTTNRGSHAITASTNDLGFRVVMRPKKGRMIFDRNLVCRLCR
jgi:formylglycine-generating enzyme required for sulfatase activity